jgi:hypothetical protein
MFEGAILSMRAESRWLRMQEFQARLGAAMGNRDRLGQELDRRLEIIEVEGCKLVGLLTWHMRWPKLKQRQKGRCRH